MHTWFWPHMAFLFTSGDVKAVLTVHHVFVDPDAVPRSQMAQSVVTHLALANANKDCYVRWTVPDSISLPEANCGWVY